MGDPGARQPLLQPEQKQQVPKKKSTLLTVCPYILGNELCERLAYYGLATNLVTYITRVMGGDPAFAAILVAVFEGTCYTTPIIGALLADSVWGRYKTIAVFSTIYLLGIVMLTVSSMVPDSDEDAETANPLQFGLLFASLAVISLGTGGIKPNVSAFGADQFNEADPQDRREKESFFNWFYLAVNVGSLIASTCIVYIQDNVSWTIGFAIPGAAMALAILLFWAGRGGYRHVPPTESPMTRVVKVVSAAMQNRWRRSHPPASVDGAGPEGVGGAGPHGAGPHGRAVGSSNGVDPHHSSDHGSYHGAGLYRQALLAQQAGANGEGGLTRADSLLQMPLTSSMSYRWLEDAVTEWQTSQGTLVTLGGGLAGYTPKQVEEVKLVLRLLPIFATTVLYWTVYTQMGTLFVQQGTLMAREVSFNGQSFTIPSASMSTFNTLSIIVLIWLYDSYLEPALKRTKRFQMTMLRRQGWGMLVATVAMVYAGLLEYWRLQTFKQRPACPLAAPHCSSGGGDLSGLMAAGNGTLAGAAAFGASGFGANYVGGDETGPTRSLLSSMVAAGPLGRMLRATGLGAGADLPPGPVPGGHGCVCANEPADLSIFWQAPSYLLIGLSEVFTSIGQLEFFYDQAPDVMRSCSMALCLLSTAIGSYLAGALTWGVQAASPAITGSQWLPRDLNQGHIDYFFYTLAALMLANLGAFLAVAVRYEYKKVEHKRVVGPATATAEESAAAAAAAASGVPGGAVPVTMGAQQVPGGQQMPPYVVGGGRRPGATAPVAIGRGPQGMAIPGQHPGAAGAPGDDEANNLEIYSRSLAYVPPSPNIPAPFR